MSKKNRIPTVPLGLGDIIFYKRIFLLVISPSDMYEFFPFDKIPSGICSGCPFSKADCINFASDHGCDRLIGIGRVLMEL